MKNYLMKNWLIFFLIITLVIGASFRFINNNVDNKVYWRDEILTSFDIAGYALPEVFQKVYDGQIRNTLELQTYQHLNPEKSVQDTINAVIVNEAAQHTPLYFLIGRYWLKIFGNSPVVTRYLSAIISLLGLPCIYWLCVELFASKLAGMLVMALTSVSLFHIYYAQEAREYSLWIVITLLSSVLFLRAKRLNTLQNWSFYTLSIVSGLYTYPFTGFVIIGHGIYLTIIEQFRFTKALKAYLAAALIGLLTFSPWLWIMLNNTAKIREMSSWAVTKFPWTSLINIWLSNVSFVFLNARPRTTIFILLLVALSFIYVCWKTPKKIWLFLVTLFASTTVPLIVIDLIRGSIVLAINRYSAPTYLAIQLTVGYFLYLLISTTNLRKIWLRRAGQIITIALLVAGIWTCNRFLQADRGWNKYDYQHIPMARIINAANSPIILSEQVDNTGLSNMVLLFSLSYLLEPKVNFLTFKPENRQLVLQNLPIYLEKYSDIFIFSLSEDLKRDIEAQKNYQLKPSYAYQESKIERGIWQLSQE